MHMKLKQSTSSLINIFIGVVIGFSCNSKTEPSREVIQEKSTPVEVSLEGQSNFRDLGGYKNANNQSIKYGMLFRSGTLSKLSDSDMAKLEDLKIKTVVNFLTEEERKARGEDRLPEGVKSVFLPISGENDEADAVLEARQTGDFSEVPADFNYQIHELLTDAGKIAYAGLFNVLSDKNNYPVVFHCSHGIHRTGTASALVLSALGISWENIEKDYLLSNEFRKTEIDKRIKALEIMAAQNPTIEDRKTNKKNIEAFYRLRPEYIEGTKHAVSQNYGSFNHYFSSLEISKSNLQQIQMILLEK